jgi:predicted Zn-dependent peptidase
MKQLSLYSKTELKNGLRIISEEIPSARSVAIGIWVDVGSRDENKDENGISHFIEHMFFKGTKKRNAKEIASYLESIGGSINAFTSHEQTCYHATILDKHVPQAVEILSDIVLHSTLSRVNIEREKSVVIEEIVEVEETPAELVHELFSDCYWRGQPLGWPIMGTSKIVRSLDRNKLISFIEKHYSSGKVVIAAAGNVAHNSFVNLVKRKFEFPVGDENYSKEAGSPNKFSMKLFKRKANQTHLCIGIPGIKFDHPERNAMLAMHTYLGGGMSSILFQKIREEKGIAYTVYTFPDFYRDNGLFGVYLAADKKRLHQAIEIILREFKKIKRDRLPMSKFEKVKAQMKGHLILNMESTGSRMNRLGRYELLTGKFVSLDDALRAIDRLKPGDITKMAREMFHHNNMTITSLGMASENDLKNVDWSLIK